MRSSMKRRVAAGSGTTVNEVNKLINQFSKVKKTMDRLGAMSRNGSFDEESLERMLDQNQDMQKIMNDPRFQRMAKKGKF